MRALESSAQRPLAEDYAWLAEGSMPASREDRIAEGIAFVALLFSLSAGIVIAMLPVSSQGAPTTFAAGSHATRPH